MVESMIVSSLLSLGSAGSISDAPERMTFDSCLTKPIGTIVNDYPTVELLNMRFCEVLTNSQLKSNSTPFSIGD